MSRGRDDFLAKTKRDLAARAGYACSFEGCTITTSGPGAGADDAVVNVGVACHIRAASRGGPRYDAAMTSAERSSIKNGIWMCQTHAKLIDSDTTTYTVERLHEWKEAAETRADQWVRSGRGAPEKAQIWNVPHRRNRFFTGRVEVLERLRAALTDRGSLALGQAISGLGGIGKTQTAVEYAYRHRDDYTAVLWTQAETAGDLRAGMVELAGLLLLPERDAEDEDQAVQAVRRWMEKNRDWLWIMDNADSPDLLLDFLPTAPRGHLLVTSRAENFDALDMEPLRLDVMAPEEALRFLLQRTRREKTSAEEQAAVAELAEAVGYLPLALEQAAAYLSVRKSRFVDYLAAFNKRSLDLLAEGKLRDGRKGVATTWSLNFEQVASEAPASAELLQLSAFFAPDGIPLEVLAEGHEGLGPILSEALASAEEDPLVIDGLLEPLSRFSLIERDIEDQTFGVHRMVQSVVRDAMEVETQKVWAERAIEGTWLADPGTDFENWSRCERLTSHWNRFVQWIDYFQAQSEAAGFLLNQAGTYAWNRAQYATAEPVFRRSIDIKEKALGNEHPSLATGLNNLALLYRSLGRYEEAEPLYKKAIEINEKVLGKEHPYLATSLDNLANLYRSLGRYEEAEPLYKKAIGINEKALGNENPGLAVNLNNLALLYKSLGRYEDSKFLYMKAIEIYEALGNEHPHLATSLDNLALLHSSHGRHEDAEPLYTRAVEIYEKSLGNEHPYLAVALNNLALLHCDQGRFEEAEPLYRQALRILDKTLGSEHPFSAIGFKNYAKLLRATDRDEEAAELEAKAATIRAKRDAKADD